MSDKRELEERPSYDSETQVQRKLRRVRRLELVSSQKYESQTLYCRVGEECQIARWKYESQRLANASIAVCITKRVVVL